MTKQADQDPPSEAVEEPEEADAEKALPPGAWVTALIVIVLLLLAVFGLG